MSHSWVHLLHATTHVAHWFMHSRNHKDVGSTKEAANLNRNLPFVRVITSACKAKGYPVTYISNTAVLADIRFDPIAKHIIGVGNGVVGATFVLALPLSLPPGLAFANCRAR